MDKIPNKKDIDDFIEIVHQYSPSEELPDVTIDMSKLKYGPEDTLRKIKEAEAEEFQYQDTFLSMSASTGTQQTYSRQSESSELIADVMINEDDDSEAYVRIAVKSDATGKYEGRQVIFTVGGKEVLKGNIVKGQVSDYINFDLFDFNKDWNITF